MPTNTNAVAIVAKSEAELLALEKRLSNDGVSFKSIRESEGEHAGQLMAIGCEPKLRDMVRRYFSSFPLLR